MSRKMDKILAEISAGELIDKITILEIKKEKIVSKDKILESIENKGIYPNFFIDEFNW